MISSGRAASLVVTSYGALAAKDFMNLATDKRNLSQYDLFQLLKYGNILPTQSPDEIENGIKEDEDAAKWTEAEHEKQMHEYERD